MTVENHHKLKAAFLAGRLDAGLAADRSRLSPHDRRSMEMLLGMVLGDADLRELMVLCEVLFKNAKEEKSQQRDPGAAAVCTATPEELVASMDLRKPGNGNGANGVDRR